MQDVIVSNIESVLLFTNPKIHLSFVHVCQHYVEPGLACQGSHYQKPLEHVKIFVFFRSAMSDAKLSSQLSPLRNSSWILEIRALDSAYHSIED